MRARFQRQGLPIISVDSKKRELIGNVKNAGAKWDRSPVPVNDHDFRSDAIGVAIPHGRIKGLKEALGAFLRLAQPVPFDAPDGNPVSLVFVLLVPEKATEKHLQILSELAQMFSDKALREGDIVGLDYGVIYDGFYGDAAVTVGVG